MKNISYIYLYVEKFNKHEKFILLDFVSDSDFFNFAKRQDYPMYDQQYFASMLLIEQVSFDKYLYLKEGSIYKVPMESLLELRWNRRLYDEIDSSIIAFTYNDTSLTDPNQGEKLSRLFQEEVSTKPFVYKLTKTWSGAPCGAKSLTKNIEVVVKQVGQGSWNEIREYEKCKVVFDIGCSIFYSKEECKTLLGDDPFKDSPSLIISHWDIDHYNLLCVTSDDDLKKICCAHVPSECISLTSKHIASRLENNCFYLCAIDAIVTRKIKRRVSLNVEYSGNHYFLLAGETSKNKNLSGLALIVWNCKSSIFFCADHSYQQVFEDMMSVAETIFLKLALIGIQHTYHVIVPHHGGNAGDLGCLYSFKVPRKAIPGKAVVSTGKNNYGHPLELVRTSFCDRGFQWTRMDFATEDVRIML